MGTARVEPSQGRRIEGSAVKVPLDEAVSLEKEQSRDHHAQKRCDDDEGDDQHAIGVQGETEDGQGVCGTRRKLAKATGGRSTDGEQVCKVGWQRDDKQGKHQRIHHEASRACQPEQAPVKVRTAS